MANLYLNETLHSADFVVGGTVDVTGDEARHAVRVSRLRVGERTLVGNGAGVLGTGVVESTDSRAFTVRLEEVSVHHEMQPRLVLVQALAKGDRSERAVEQATEFGVDEVLPWEAERSISRWGPEKAERGIEKWARVAREAAKQSLRARPPRIERVVTTNELVEQAADAASPVLVLHPAFDQTLSAWAADFAQDVTSAGRSSIESITVVVGPEGGLSPREVSELAGAGALVLGLGDTVLRTSSAGPAAIAVLNVALGRW